MAVRDNAKGTLELFEVKHSSEVDPSQARHLTDRTLLALAERQFGKVVARTVLYRGEDLEASGSRRSWCSSSSRSS